MALSGLFLQETIRYDDLFAHHIFQGGASGMLGQLRCIENIGVPQSFPTHILTSNLHDLAWLYCRLDVFVFYSLGAVFARQTLSFQYFSDCSRGTTSPSFLICQWSFNAHFLVCFLNSMICSLILTGVSFCWVLRVV